MHTKGDLINRAYSKGRISGLTAQPTPEDMLLALDVLEDMAEQWAGNNICTGYNFEDDPDVNSPTNLERKHRGAYISNLAFWLLIDFGKDPKQALVLEQQKDLSFISANTATVQQIPYPNRMARGGGNTLRYNRYQRFYRDQPASPTSCATQTMFITNIDNFVEHFDAYLGASETISSYTIKADNWLVIVSDSLSSPDISYEIRADGNGDNQSNAQLQVIITVTTSIGRVETRVINFTLKEVPEVN